MVDSFIKRSDKVIMIVEDNTFDFLVRDRLKKECEESREGWVGGRAAALPLQVVGEWCGGRAAAPP